MITEFSFWLNYSSQEDCWCLLLSVTESLRWHSKKIPAESPGKREGASGAERGCENTSGEF